MVALNQAVLFEAQLLFLLGLSRDLAFGRELVLEVLYGLPLATSKGIGAEGPLSPVEAVHVRVC